MKTLIITGTSKTHQKDGMDHFKSVVQSCDQLVAFGFGDNSIGAGIAKEMNWMLEKGGKVIFLPFFNDWEELLMASAENQFTVLSVDDTRAKLKSYEE